MTDIRWPGKFFDASRPSTRWKKRTGARAKSFSSRPIRLANKGRSAYERLCIKTAALIRPEPKPISNCSETTAMVNLKPAQNNRAGAFFRPHTYVLKTPTKLDISAKRTTSRPKL